MVEFFKFNNTHADYHFRDVPILNEDTMSQEAKAMMNLKTLELPDWFLDNLNE